MLNAFYDFAVSPAKYDFVAFLLDAERYRQLTGQDGIRLVFVPGPNNGFREDKLPPASPDFRAAMMNNILMPMCAMIGCPVKGVVCQTRKEAAQYQTGEIFPSEYRVTNPTAHYGMQINARSYERKFYPFKAYKPIPKQPDLVTITLRESHYWPTRNSNRETWLAAAEKIKNAGLRVLFIPDVDSPPVEGWDSDPLASIDLHRRAALYESAAHNFFVSNGPAWMAASMGKAACTVFKMVAEAAACTSPKFFRSIGFPVGSQIGRDNHLIVWEDDTKEAVLPVVERVIEGLKSYDFR